jgi:hypothetical protein
LESWIASNPDQVNQYVHRSSLFRVRCGSLYGFRWRFQI